MSDLPRVTVIIVTNVPTKPTESLNDVMVKPLRGPVLRAIHSVERQDYPTELVDISVIRNVESYPLEDMRRFGVEKAKTMFVAFLDETEYWFPSHLTWAVHQVYPGKADKVSNFYGQPILIRKEAYLRDAADR